MCTRPDAAGSDQKSVYLWLINWFQSRKELWPRIDTDETRFRKLTQGIRNTANGYQALLNNTTGSNNTANGLNALFSNTGSNNTAVGVGGRQQPYHGR
jgi:hypothetical protein